MLIGYKNIYLTSINRLKQKLVIRIIQQNQQFDFYDGGGLDMTCLGMAECDLQGNVNTSKFGGRLNGCGGFINISQNARLVIFAGTFTNGGLKVEVTDGKVNIVQEGRNKKFLNSVEQITFSGKYAQKRKQPVYYVTERCVFKLVDKGLELVEIAPGIDIDKHILPFMDFKPIINEPELMDRRIFIDEPMGLINDLLNLNLDQRITYDPARNILFLNLEGWIARTFEDTKLPRSSGVDAIVTDTNALPVTGPELRTIVMQDAENFLRQAHGMKQAMGSDEIGGGNPALKPYLSTNLDLGFEYYTGREGVISFNAFRKSLEGFTTTAISTVPFSNLAQYGITYDTLNPTQQIAINSRGGPSQAQVQVTSQVNVPNKLTINGLEFQWVQPLDFLTRPLGITGFGLLIGLGMYLLVTHTRIGMLIRAGAFNREMVGALGVNIGERTARPYDPKKDLALISRAAESPFILVAAPSLAAKTLADIAAGKHPFADVLKNAKKPMLIVGQGALAPELSQQFLATAAVDALEDYVI